MAYSQVGTAHQKMSFAKIAALPAPNMKPALPNTYQNGKYKPAVTGGQQTSIPAANGFSTRDQYSASEIGDRRLQVEPDQVRSAIEHLSIIAVTSTNAQEPPNDVTGEPSDDGQSQVSSSSLKQQSFETTSVASITTFAMDEKESIRPDDSASVRAAEDDEIAPSISRHSSFQHDTDVPFSGQRASVRGVGPNVTIAARRYPGLTMTNPPRFGDLPVSPGNDIQITRSDASNSPASALGDGKSQLAALTATPDEKLLEALASPKDRLPLLQLEERIMAFVARSRDDVFDLPPQNSFNRLLTHKLADYYGLAHQVNEDNSSVRIFRTGHCTMPLSLAEIAKSIHLGPQHVSAATQIKIMRRAQFGRQFSAGNSTTASSSVPSKATSETGLDYGTEDGLHSPLDGTPGRDKPKSREEREAQYRAARERIFGDFQESVTSESGSTGETSASMSRSSSTSGSKKKSRKQKAPKDDSFTRRSEFVAYGPMQMQQTIQPQYHDVTYPEFNNTNGNYMYGTNHMLPFPGYEFGVVYGGHNAYQVGNGQINRSQGGWENGQQPQGGTMFNIEAVQPMQQRSNLLPPIRDQFPAHLPTMSQPQAWMQPQYSNTFHQSNANMPNSQWQNLSTGSNLSNTSYQYTALPNQMYANTNANANPYMNQQVNNFAYTAPRSLFNPHTRSFVPNNTSNRGGGRSARKKAMSNDVNPRLKEASSVRSRPNTLRSGTTSAELREDSLQQKYGAPANLPKKPPPSQVVPHFSGDPTVGSLQARPHTPGNGAQFVIGSAQSLT